MVTLVVKDEVVGNLSPSEKLVLELVELRGGSCLTGPEQDLLGGNVSKVEVRRQHAGRVFIGIATVVRVTWQPGQHEVIQPSQRCARPAAERTRRWHRVIYVTRGDQRWDAIGSGANCLEANLHLAANPGLQALEWLQKFRERLHEPRSEADR